MTKDERMPAAPVVGEVIGRSAIKTIGGLLFMLLVFVFGLFLVGAWCMGLTFDRFGTPHQVTWWGLIIGACGVLGAPFLVWGMLYQLISRERLVLGEDRLQMLRRQKGTDVVVLQLPYRNIADLSYVVTDAERLLKIDLVEIDDPNTFGADFKNNKENEECHYTIRGGYKVGVAGLHKKLQQKAGIHPRKK